MADKKTKKEIKAVLDKYNYSEFYADASNIASTLTTFGIAVGTGVSMILDITLTGGITSAVWLGLTGGLGSIGLFGAGALIFKKTLENSIGQKIKYNSTLMPVALNKMENKLRASFNKASAPDAKPEDKSTFMLLADEIGQDVRKLSAAFKIISGGPNGAGTDKYEFMVDKEKCLTLDQALQYLQQPPAPKKMTLEEEVQNLKQQVEELKNPRIVKLDKNPPRP